MLVFDPAINGDPILDVLRFTGNSQLIVYSDDLNGIQSPADTPGPPNPFSVNLLEVNKTHPMQGLGIADFTPTAGEPGFDVSNPSYDFLDPGIVPEPSAGAVLLAGLGILAAMRLMPRPSKSLPASHN